jgi:hypothetical protein
VNLLISLLGITLVNIGSGDINEGKMIPTLGLVWTLILRYQINKRGAADEGGKDGLLNWVNSVIFPLGLVCKNFSKGFQDPRVLSALVNKLQVCCLE